MFTDDEKAFLARATTTMQIIVGSLAGGVVMFFLVTVVLFSGSVRQPPETPSLSYMAIASAITGMLLALLLPGIVLRSRREATLAGKMTSRASSVGGPPLPEGAEKLLPFVGGYQTAVIIRSAVLEGAAFFCLIAYMMEGQAWTLVGAGVLLLLILAGMPTRSRVEDAAEHEQRAIAELREMRLIDAR